ncbi:Nlrc3, partial [Symbiodinium sp. KB8]
MATEGKEYDLADKNQLAAFLEDADIQLGGPGTRRISKDALHFIVRNLKGDRFTVEMLQAETACPACCNIVPEQMGQDIFQELPKRYDLAQKQGLADFLKDADIRLVRADFILKLHREGQRFPRRQEAESAYVDSRTALVTHEEVQDWADGEAPDGTQVISLSHCWESREHCDPYGYQVSKLAKALTGKEWLFIDYVSLHQFQRLSQQQNLSFGRWCAAEREWSSTRAATNLSREIDAPEDEKGGMAPMSPEAFEKDVAGRLKFTHQNDEKTVCRLQAEVYKEKAKTCRSLRLVDLRADALDIALSALEHYPVLESLEIVHCELRPKLPLLLKALEKIKLRQLHLQQNELFEEGTRQVIEALALQSNGTLTALSLGHVDVAGVKALAE